MEPSRPADVGKTGRLIMICGPSGVGKSTLVARLRKDPRVVFSVSATTRTPRQGEVNGIDYRFVSRADFEEGLRRGEFLEHAEVYGNFYGTPKKPLEEAVARGRYPLLEIDMQGVRQIQALGFPSFSVFIAPPDLSSLEKRLSNRRSESPEQLRRRLGHARAEIDQKGLCNRVVVNDDVERAYRELMEILANEVFGR